ncbi:glycosyltransferase family 2 protein [Piscinibacter sakaiensis]|uniref:glycosyltransferase family 2 protein n=1 Tax=Piscinibacter sakaiensis TaxID=1547922 RepID=UPI0009ECB154|nr:glycosyltransferase family 2 protein [Piscinibacter sakaiensis]
MSNLPGGNPFFSIIVPVYNVLDFLEAALLSVRNQTFTDFECIIVDDGSTDASRAEAKRLIDGDLRFSILAQENQGLSAARNTGINHSRGEVIYFLDSDDAIDLSLLERLKNAFSNEIVDAVFFEASLTGDVALVSADREQYVRPDFGGALTPIGEFLCRSAKERKLPVQACCYAIRRRTLGGLRFTKGIFFEDNDFFWKMTTSCRSIICLNEKLYLHRIRAGSIMQSKYDRRHFDSCRRIAYEIYRTRNVPDHLSAAKAALEFLLYRITGDMTSILSKLPLHERGALTRAQAAYTVYMVRGSVGGVVRLFKRMVLAIFPELYLIGPRSNRES